MRSTANKPENRNREFSFEVASSLDAYLNNVQTKLNFTARWNVLSRIKGATVHTNHVEDDAYEFRMTVWTSYLSSDAVGTIKSIDDEITTVSGRTSTGHLNPIILLFPYSFFIIAILYALISDNIIPILFSLLLIGGYHFTTKFEKKRVQGELVNLLRTGNKTRSAFEDWGL